MKKALALFAVVLTLGMSVAVDAEARRLGGARSSGMQRQAAPPQQPASPSQPGSPASTPNAPTAAPAAAGTAGAAAATQRRSWAGPLTGLAAGLGLAALASYLGFGQAFANIMLILLIGLVALVAVSYFMRKRAAAQNPAMAGAGGSPWQQRTSTGASRETPNTPAGQGGSMIGSRLGAGIASRLGGTPATPPADFDAAAFVRNAKGQFLALQAANDTGDLARLREFLTPEMFEVVRDEISVRGNVPQKTEVFGLEGQVVEVTQDGGSYIVSVRFTGSIREQHGAVPEDLDEIWHLTKPANGSGGWVIAGIQQSGASS